jgi:MFS family permease
MTDQRHPFAFRDFRFFWTARFCSTVAQSSMVVVMGWQVYDIARLTMGTRQAAFQLGLIGAAGFMPLFALTLVSGWTADRVDRRVIARLCIALQLICAGTLGWLNFTGHVSLIALFAVAGLLGVARAFSMPALHALAPNLVPAGVLPRAIATNSIAVRVGAIIGPAAGGYLYAWGPPTPYLVTGSLLGVSLLSLLMIRPIARTTMTGSRHPWRQMMEGLHFIRGNRLVLGAMLLDLFAVLFGGATAMLPIFARDILQVGPTGLGDLRAAAAIGGTLTAVWFSYRPLKRNVGVKMLSAVGVYGGATIVFGLSRWLPLSLACLATLGAADMLSVYVRQSLMQLGTPNQMRGRVAALSTLFISASDELGEVESGFLAALIGPVASVVAGGAGAIAVALLWVKLFPALRHARSFEQPPPDPLILETTTVHS